MAQNRCGDQGTALDRHWTFRAFELISVTSLLKLAVHYREAVELGLIDGRGVACHLTTTSCSAGLCGPENVQPLPGLHIPIVAQNAPSVSSPRECE